jgi:pimeloyl-ACP methyl ester carboxylesterase
MSREAVALAVDGQRVSGRLARADEGHNPLLVCLHGGSYTSTYFDLPGHSLLDVGAANGFSVLALDRPGYGDSDPITGQPISFQANAEVLDGAIGDAWEQLKLPSTGVVLVGHSMGGAIALMIAARQSSWPLLGVAATGIGDVLPPGVADAWRSMPEGQPVVFDAAQRRQFMYGPDWTLDDGIVADAEVSTAPIPLEELLEVVGEWVAAFPEVAAQVGVPVQYALAEYDGLWVADDGTVERFAARFTAAPFVEAALFRGAGHNIDHHKLGSALHLEQLAFALRCAGESMRRGN